MDSSAHKASPAGSHVHRANGTQTSIVSSDYDAFVSEIASQIWNVLIEKPEFQKLKPNRYADLFAVVSQSLAKYRHPSNAQ
jgi:hypothetical protein